MNPQSQPVLLNLLITEMNSKYSLSLQVTLQEDLFIGEVRITEEGRVILRDKSIDLFRLRGEDFYDFLTGVSEEERRILMTLSWMLRVNKRKFQICIGVPPMKEIDYEEEYCRLSLRFDKYVEYKREEGRTNYNIEYEMYKRLRELEEENEELRLDFYTREPKEDLRKFNRIVGGVLVLCGIIAVLIIK